MVLYNGINIFEVRTKVYRVYFMNQNDMSGKISFAPCSKRANVTKELWFFATFPFHMIEKSLFL